VGIGSRLRALAIDFSPLGASRDFRLLWSGQLVSQLGRQITTVAIPYQVYVVSHSALAVGTLGLVQLGPYIIMSLVGGTVADRFDRRRVLLVTQAGLAASSGLLVLTALQPHPPLVLLYCVAALASAISAVDLPARAATIPNLVPRDKLPAALSLNFALFQATLIAGPALGGLVIGRFGLAAGYGIDVATFAASILAAFLLTPQPPRERHDENPLVAIGRGLALVFRRRALLGGFLADLDAMIFGMPRALFPVLALGAYHAGPRGLGLLYAAPGVGAVIGTGLSGFVGRLRHQGRAVLLSVAIWGACIALFGLTTFSLVAGMALLAIGGAADAISALCRSVILQTIAPDNFRGRVSATNSMVVVGGPYLGDFRAGAVANVAGAPFALVSGGVACIVLAGILGFFVRDLWDYDST
jgi:MFS family permease